MKTNTRVKHGGYGSKLYNIWRGMKERCNNPNFKQYNDYGGRGITVYFRWLNCFISFRYWAIKNGYVEGLEIDRIDNNQGYNPFNCRFTTHKANNRNKRDTKYIVFNGNKKCLSEWAELYNIHIKTLSNRLKRGWTIDKSLNTPIQKNQYT